MDAAQDVVDLMKRYPEDTSFFIDCWTWGFEEVFLAIGKTLRDATGQGARVHVDPYKWSMYTLAGDRSLPFLTKTASATRFHACERTQECDHMWEDASLTIGESEAACHLVDHWTGPVHSVPLSRQEQEYYETQVRESAAQSSAAAGSSAVSPLTVYVKVLGTSIEEWATLRAQSHAEIDKAQRGEASYPAWLACPLQRHSCLPELQRLVRSFRPCTVTPTSSQEDHYFLASRLLGPYLGPGGQQRIEREAREATPSDVWRVCEERMPSGGLGDAEDWNEVLKKYHEARQPPLDLSQSGAVSKGRARDEEHEDADVSNSRVSASLPAPVASAPITSNPQVAVAAPSSSAAGPPSITSPSASGARILDDDLARRFFVVLRMCVVPHLKLLNVPGGTEGSEAWRAVRKLKPGWAATAERIMYKYTEVLGDDWACSAYVRDEVGQTRKRVKKESGANALAGPSRLAVAGGTSRGVGRQDDTVTCAELREADEDWLPLLLSQLDTQPSAPLRLVEDLCSASATHLAAIHAELELQAGVYGRVRTEAMQRVNGSAVLARQAGFIVEGLARSIALVGQGEGDDGVGMRRETFLRLVALTDVALQIAALLLGSGGVEEDIVDQLRPALVSCGEGLKRMLSSLEGGGLAWAQQEREDGLVLLRRLEKTMRMAEEEAA
ncbi:hypothetical protein BDZ90DRAFT_233928 [Jaminaea rosea]|uniref:Uncharacterized protein n=1 Tax=Jaminaea rosea TaxID=1569628 RepID=A0A316UQS2_9BASI|nr:hypothetical protein BDZ90DRAFT_233928 [Jaminaea rosea]PWN25475.1 hypothetical protein BDZ90DRAFT_233928 [Jaminaea rosea]